MHNQPHTTESRKLISEQTRLGMARPEVFAKMSEIRRNKNKPKGVRSKKKCLECRKEYTRRIGMAWKTWIQKKFCSKACQGLAFGKRFSGENNPSKGKRNESSIAWKGDKIGYSAIHFWLRDRFGKAEECENMNCLGKSRTYEWAKLKEKEYERKRENFWQLCHSCHKKYDA